MKISQLNNLVDDEPEKNKKRTVENPKPLLRKPRPHASGGKIRLGLRGLDELAKELRKG